MLVDRDREHPLTVRGHADGADPASAEAVYRQRPWLRWWAIPVLPVLIALLVYALAKTSGG